MPAGSCRSRRAAATQPRSRSASRGPALGRAAQARARRSGVPDAPFVHVFVARGGATLEGAGRWRRAMRPAHRRRRPRAHRRSHRGGRGPHLGDGRRAAGRRRHGGPERWASRPALRKAPGGPPRRPLQWAGGEQLPTGRTAGAARSAPEHVVQEQALTAVASTGPSGRSPGSLEMTSGPAAESSVGRPCEPFTRLASSGITSIRYRKPRAFFASRQPIFAFGSRSAGSRNSSTGS